ncbi:MAG: hypothetical protein ACR2MU_00355 [Gaiellaceae bacterium]
MLGLAAVLTLPVALLVARQWSGLGIRDSVYSFPLALVLGALAVVQARRGREHAQWTLGRGGGERLASAGRMLGVLGISLGLAGGVALAVYAFLRHQG